MKSLRLACAWAFASITVPCFAGKAIAWSEVPEAVRKTIIAHGGQPGSVDLEDEKIGGQAVYEVQVKDQAGKKIDLVIASDGKLVETKSDDATDRAGEIYAAARAKRNPLAGKKFSHPLEINHSHLPLASLSRDVFEGKEGGKIIRFERKRMPGTKTFMIASQSVEALIFEDRVFKDGLIEEVAIDYFAQSDDGTVFYFGENVDDYENGKFKNHDGTWLLGEDTPNPGVMLPANPKVGDKFMTEDVSHLIHENDVIISVTETVTTPAGTFRNCVKVQETLADGAVEYKFYAPGVGVVKELPADGELLLILHETIKRVK